MPLSQQTIQDYKTILTEELLVAMGCTEPISIAYAAAILRKALGAEPGCIHAQLSGNIIKNVKSVIVPATGGLHGIEAAISAGIVAAAPEKKLEVLSVLTSEKQKNHHSDNSPFPSLDEQRKHHKHVHNTFYLSLNYGAYTITKMLPLITFLF